MTIIPVIDIEPWIAPGRHSDHERQDVVKIMSKACEEVGFFAIQNHGVEQLVMNRALVTSQAFFDLPLERKQVVSFANVHDYPYGYENSEVLSQGKQTEQQQQQQQQQNGSSTSSTSITDYDSTTSSNTMFPDLKETFAIGPYNPEAGMPERRFPVEPVELGPALSVYYVAMERLALQLLQILAHSLKLPNPETWFASKMDHHLSALRILNYFPIQRSKLRPGQLRASAHTDYGALTILKSDGPGLQVKKDLDSEDWVDVPYLPDTFIINLGDMMCRWTNGTCSSELWPSSP